jgi:hypothetical protein
MAARRPAIKSAWLLQEQRTFQILVRAVPGDCSKPTSQIRLYGFRLGVR